MPFPPLPTHLADALTARGYAEPTPVQAAVLQEDAVGRDLLVSAQTGSGKTVAFGLAMAPDILGERGLPAPRAPLALVIAPTRELAQQVQRELAWLWSGARVLSCVGGFDPRREAWQLGSGAHIVVGTPGRLCDHLERGNLDLSAVKAVVLDEADEMLDLGFRDELERLLEAAPKERRTLMFSATVPKGIGELAAHYQKNALRIAASSEKEPHADIAYRAVLCAPAEREHVIVNVLRVMDEPAALVFCHTRDGVNHLHASLVERGFAAVALSGELSQSERTRALQTLRDGRARVCVATDVAARGLDLPDLGLVLHADLPREPATLLHRSGRTGRAGRKGTAVALVPFNRRRAAERLFQEARVEPEWTSPPTAEQVREKDDTRLLAELRALADEPAEEDLVLARKLLEERTPEALAAALVRHRRAQLPPPEDVTAPPLRDERPERRPMPPPPSGDVVIFRINVGRAENADPRWLLPLLCRRGRIGKEDIGRISIFAHESRVEISARAAERFAEGCRRPDKNDPYIRIAPMRS